MKYGHSNTKGERSKIAIVTGCSSGIGFETSLLFARNGIYTYATMRNVSKSNELLAFAKRESLPLKVISLDVTNEDSIEQTIETVTHEQNRIDILVNNAGYSLVGALEMLYMEEIKEEFETNFLE
jgi:NAD(P)-dependent dehydrogenase (short-subunit alcohol dehydrogenase family)